MSHAVDTAINERCDLAIIAGDSFDAAVSAHEPAFAAYVRQVVRLAGDMPVVVLQGTHSHDRPGSLDVLKSIPTKYDIIVADTVNATVVAGAYVTWLPSLNKADPAVMSEGANAWTARVLTEFSEQKERGLSPGMPTILVTHGTVCGCTTESGYSMVSPDLEFSVENLAAADCDAVMLGHIHLRQEWPNVRTPSGGVTTIAYPGSIARLVHGHHDPVGFLIWEIEPGNATFTFHESPSRGLVELKFDGPPDFDELRHAAASIKPDDAVRIRYEIDEEHAASVNKQEIREMFSGAESCKIEARVLPVQRVRAVGINAAMGLHDKLAHWADTTGSVAALERLQHRLGMLQSMDTDKIVETLK